MALAVGGIGLLQAPGNLGAAADAHPEAADGPEQEFHIPLHIPVIGLSHFRGAVDEGVLHGDAALVPLHGDGNGLLRALEVGGAPDPEGNKAGVQLGSMLHFIINA